MIQKFRNFYRQFDEWRSPEARALRRLRRSIGGMPRYQSGRAKFWGWDIEFVDAASCISAFDYIVSRRWNDFTCNNPNPRILDCGANIGLSVLHFKYLFPNASITAFEPDPEIAEVLRRNIRVNKAYDVEVVEAALWDQEGTTTFFSEGADGGRIQDNTSDSPQIVRTLRLIDFLTEPVDLIKLDIEGAESRVIVDCRDYLHLADRLILEYHNITGNENSLSSILSVLESAGFDYFVNSPPNFWIDLRHRPLTGDNSLEQFLMIYALKER